MGVVRVVFSVLFVLGLVAIILFRAKLFDAESPLAIDAPSQSSPSELRSQYDFDKPSQTIVLPKILEEASGLTDISLTEVALVQDEKGIIFIFDLEKESITKRIPFAGDGDYEGASRVGYVIVVLMS